MSYILDALRRADAEREGAAVSPLARAPAEPLDDLLDEEPAAEPRTAPRKALWLGGALGALGLLALLAWWLGSGQEQPLVAVTAAPAQTETQLPAPSPAPVAAPTAPIGAPVTAPPAPASRAVLPPLTEPPRVAPLPTLEKPPMRSAVAPVAPPPEPKASAVSEPAHTPALAQLPEAFRRSLPAVRISGATYSPLPSARMLIVNGQVHQEGGEPAPGLKIREIKLRSAILEYGGQRFEVGF
jgi:general secretion pathway protein B